MNLIILTPGDRLEGHRYRVDGRRAEHIRSVLRLKPGDTVAVGVLDGPRGRARVVHVAANAVTLACETLTEQPMPRPAIDVVCALPRPQTLRKVLITAAMMGVRRLDLIRAHRVEKSYFHTPLLARDKFTPYLIEGLSQGKLTRLPVVGIHERFRRFVEDTLPSREAAQARLLADPGSDIGLDRLYDGSAERLIVAIGPEGGWVPFEIELLERAGFRRFTLGRWILRVETAVAAALSQIELVGMRRRRIGH